MNDTVFWRLVWKEYRVQRAFWIAMAVLIVILQSIVAAFFTGAEERTNLLFHFALALPAFYALGCAATLFATEHETGTYEFQRALPVTARRLFFGKLACAIAGTVLMIVVFWLLAVALAGWRLPQPRVHGLVWGLWGMAAVELTAWGTLCSLLSTRPLKAALLAVGGAAASVFSVAAVSQRWHGAVTYVDILEYRIAIAVAVIAADVWLGYRWFRDRTAASGGILGFGRSEAVTDEAAEALSRVSVPAGTVLGRLIWQQWRQSARMLLVFAAMVVPMLVFCVWRWAVMTSRAGRRVDADFEGLVGSVVILSAMVTGPLLASCTFLSDQWGAGLGFLAERGVRPRLVWLSRQLVWFPAVLVWVGVVGLAVAITSRETATEIVPLAVAMALGLAILVFSAGQLCSMLFRSGVIAAFFTFVLTGVLYGWAALMDFWGLNWIWALVPIPPVLLLATWLRAPGWLLQRKSLRSWLATAGVLLLLSAALLTAVPVVRVCEYPLVDPGFSPEEYDRPITAEQQATVDLYRRAYERFVWQEEDDDEAEDANDAPEPPLDAPLCAREIAWIEANRQAIALAIKASQRQDCCFVDPTDRTDRMDVAQRCRSLGRVLVASARKLESEGELEAAMQRYLAALRMSRHLRVRASSVGPLIADAVEGSVLDRLPYWAAHPDQSPPRIRQALGRFDELMQNVPSRDEAIKGDYIYSRQVILADPDVFAAFDSRQDMIMTMTLWSRWLPWERARALRMLNYITASNLLSLRTAELRLRQGEGSTPPLNRRGHRGEPHFALRGMVNLPMARCDYDQDFRLLMRQSIWMATRRNATRLLLALEAYKSEHGRLPENLEELLGTYLDSLPEDPCSGKPFRYLPEGVAARVSWAMWYHQQEKVVQSNTPFLWSTGEQVHDRGLDPDDEFQRRYRIFSDGGAVLRDPRSEMEVWSYGWLFPLP